MVFQDVFMFHTTIRENLAYGANGVTDAGIEEAAKAAQLHEHIISLPDGYDTLVGERGATLSGGQKQRMAIARTLLLNPPVLILEPLVQALSPSVIYPQPLLHIVALHSVIEIQEPLLQI